MEKRAVERLVVCMVWPLSPIESMALRKVDVSLIRRIATEMTASMAAAVDCQMVVLTKAAFDFTQSLKITVESVRAEVDLLPNDTSMIPRSIERAKVDKQYFLKRLVQSFQEQAPESLGGETK